MYSEFCYIIYTNIEQNRLPHHLPAADGLELDGRHVLVALGECCRVDHAASADEHLAPRPLACSGSARAVFFESARGEPQKRDMLYLRSSRGCTRMALRARGCVSVYAMLYWRSPFVSISERHCSNAPEKVKAADGELISSAFFLGFGEGRVAARASAEQLS